MALLWSWVGAVTDTEATVVVRLDAAASTVALRVSTDPTFATYTDTATVVPDANNVAKVSVSGLTPRTKYQYQVLVDGAVAGTDYAGRWFTFPSALDRASFSIAHGGDAATGSTHAVFTAIRDRRPLLFCHLGDFHYENIGVNDEATFRAAYDSVLASAGQHSLLRMQATAYVWDDHDYGPDNSGASATGRPAAHAVYRQMVPHYPLAGGGITPIYQAWSIGRVRFLATDLRTERSSNSATDDATKTMLGATQKQWLKDEMAAARDAGYRAIVWLNSQVWPTETGEGSLGSDTDHWGSFGTERTEISDYIADEGIPEVVVLSADAHMLAAKANALYATDGTREGMTVLQGAALGHGTGHTRGASWDVGPTAIGTGGYGWLNVQDEPEGILLDWHGIQVSAAGVSTRLMGLQRLISTARPATTYFLLDGGGNEEAVVKDATGLDRTLYVPR